MARVPYFDLAQASDTYRQLIGSRPPLNLYRMLPHAGKVAEGFLALGGAILRENRLDSRLREIAILRVGLLCGSSYEVHQHRRVARNVGLADDKVAALEPGADPGALDATERMVLDYVDQVVEHVKAPDEMFEALCKQLSPALVAELTLVIGFYMMVSRFLENFEVDIEDTPPPPPAG
ncbi:carboxymuconolactone decarboxylase family protein [Pseudacidovorax sp. RU35E]|uniref:carboxymuconolactone decarboxylase family protein n=1 Tax=Pseudacidovorax sp. RU35E TaxID=1907403 RepID=UPI000955735B|nr:carboxymuconolactone decarboxylase family protein [Pseudacidovorax sp. RU35E]SIR61238.1 Alkylhydroperoxidase family enzyme, contains CxxC motif [Pseudacidovorax sp. RU35E]